ncbi:hypothetical protein FGO68_gene1612 [Halteria grandinella]|uniref:Uncharacterized protein n=1 Tax=Halteria grandinella TaxID=5974 RepID=A0A8J8P685_HALGN|nr:hypothetical protein FGO68_gene1612 [Halteria grandinella]
MPITLAKWSILSTTLVFLKDYPSFQLMIIQFILFASQVLIIIGKPLDSRLENNITLFNELMTSLFLYGLFTLTDSMGRNESKVECGLAMLYLVFFTISVNMFKVLVQLILMINFRILFKKLTRKSKDKVISHKPSELIATSNLSLIQKAHNKMALRQLSTVSIMAPPDNASFNAVFSMRQMQY